MALRQALKLFFQPFMMGRIELFSKWIKQHLRSKALGASGPCAALSLRVQLLAEISIERKNRINVDDLANVGGLKIERPRGSPSASALHHR